MGMLFEPVNIGPLKLENRIVRAATYEKRADENGFVTDSLVDLYENLATGGAGLIITGCALVHVSGRMIPRMLCAHSDIYTDGLRRLTDAVHDIDGRIALQIAHGGRQCSPRMLGGEEALAPSAIYDPSTRSTPRAMDDHEIWEMVEAFADAAWRAQFAGFDAVELHAAHGYLISSFLSPYTNRRDDYWGGDEERRFHFLEEIIKAVTDSVGWHFPLLVKMNAADMVPGGLEPEEAGRIAQRLGPIGVAAIELSGGMRESETPTIRPGISKPEDEAYFRAASWAFKQIATVPIILTGGMRSRAVMEDVISSGACDMVGISRPLIREPLLPVLMRDEGKEAADCTSCNKCTRFFKLKYVRCKEIPPPPDVDEAKEEKDAYR